MDIFLSVGSGVEKGLERTQQNPWSEVCLVARPRTNQPPHKLQSTMTPDPRKTMKIMKSIKIYEQHGFEQRLLQKQQVAP